MKYKVEEVRFSLTSGVVLRAEVEGEAMQMLLNGLVVNEFLALEGNEWMSLETVEIALVDSDGRIIDIKADSREAALEYLAEYIDLSFEEDLAAFDAEVEQEEPVRHRLCNGVVISGATKDKAAEMLRMYGKKNARTLNGKVSKQIDSILKDK